MPRILLVEDDSGLAEGLAHYLERNGFEVARARTAAEAHPLAREGRPDLILLDLSLPDGSGFEVCRRARLYTKAPIVFLSASDEEVDVVRGLDLGADEYVTKPFKLGELLARIKALLRRAGLGRRAEAELESNGIRVILRESRVLKGGAELQLTAGEYRLLCLLMGSPGAVLSREAIAKRLWEGGFAEGNTLSVYVRRLREKIEDDPQAPASILTVRNSGYKWQPRD